MCDAVLLKHKQQLTYVQDDYNSTPSSPELGMGSPKGSEVDSLELDEPEDQNVTEAESLDTAVSGVMPITLPSY
jgi:hypothetical protein